MQSPLLRSTPDSMSAGLLILRIWFGGAMLALHGFDKLQHFSTYSGQFMDFMGLGPTASLALTVFAEAGLAALLVLGLFTRLAALGSVITMAVAFFMAHGGQLKGENSGEMAFIYLGAFLVLLVAGGGSYSLDARLQRRKTA